MGEYLKFLLSLSLVLNQFWIAEARAQGSAAGLTEFSKRYAAAVSLEGLAKSLKGRVNESMLEYALKKIGKNGPEKLPTLILKGDDEIEITHRSLILIVKVPTPYVGVVLFNNRPIDLNALNDPELLYNEVRKAFPRKTASLIFELLFPNAEAKDITPTRVTPGEFAPGNGGVKAPGGATQAQPGINMPAYTASGSAFGAPALNTKAPAAPKSGSSMGPLLMMAMVAMLAAMFMKGGGSECGNVEKRSQRCEEFRMKLSSGGAIGNDGMELATEHRADNGKDQCGGKRSKADDCMSQLRSTARQRGLEIGDVLPQLQPSAPGGGRL